MDRAETVTLFNDLCILAPSALIDAPISWQDLGDDHVRGVFTNEAHTETADLIDAIDCNPAPHRPTYR